MKTEDYDAYFFEELARVEEGHFWFDTRNDLLRLLMTRFVQKKEGNFLEIGCGTGFVLSMVDRNFNFNLTACEIYSEGIKIAEKRVPKAKFMQFDARNIPFENHFDVIGAFDVIEHIQEDETVLKSMRKALKENGTILLSVPQHMFLWSTVDEQAFHKRRYSRKELVEKLSKSGFEIIFTTSFMSLLLPFMYLVRLTKKNRPAGKMDEFKIGKFTNAILKLTTFMEFVLVKYLRVSLPMGGSLLVVARKKS